MSDTTIKFGTDGWRAVIAREYTFANLERVAQAYADYLNGEAGAAGDRPLSDRRLRSAVPVGIVRRSAQPKCWPVTISSFTL